MSDIKFGDIEYFVLLDLRDKLKYYQYDKLGLSNLDKLRHEVYFKIEQIHYANKKAQEQNEK